MKKLFKIEAESGQATTEYALVLLGAAVIALLVIAWATDGGGAGRIGELFDTVLSGIFDRTDALEQ
jgi:Flp pilus assembly pilin Flp